MQLDLEELISLLGDTHANPLAKQVKDKAKKMNVISGQKCYELSKVANHDTLWLKMLLVMSQWASTRCLLTWKIKDTPQGRLLYQLVPKTHHIDETEFGSSDSLLPTPTTQEIEHPEVTLTKNNRRLSKDGKSSHSLNLADTMKLWPTPTANEPKDNKKIDHYIKTGKIRHSPTGYKSPRRLLLQETVIAEEKIKTKMWPTPNASEARQGYQDRTKGKLGTQKSLSTEIIDNEGGRQATVGQLNSEWVTWLMGYPQGYLDISTENQNISQELQQEKKTEPKS